MGVVEVLVVDDGLVAGVVPRGALVGVVVTGAVEGGVAAGCEVVDDAPVPGAVDELDEPTDPPGPSTAAR